MIGDSRYQTSRLRPIAPSTQFCTLMGIRKGERYPRRLSAGYLSFMGTVSLATNGTSHVSPPSTASTVRSQLLTRSLNVLHTVRA